MYKPSRKILVVDRVRYGVTRHGRTHRAYADTLFEWRFRLVGSPVFYRVRR